MGHRPFRALWLPLAFAQVASKKKKAKKKKVNVAVVLGRKRERCEPAESRFVFLKLFAS